MDHTYHNSVVVSVKNLTFGYSPDNLLFRNFNWQVRKSERWSIVGPSGCGKTTLLYLLAGLRSPGGGTVNFQETTATNNKPTIGLMLQDYGLLPWLTARGNVQLGMKIRGVSDKLNRETSAYWLNRLGLENVSNQTPSHMSGGQRQRVALARVLALQPTTLLLDEPFSSVDELTRERLQELLLELVSETRVSVVLVTHNIEEAALLSQHVLVITEHSPIEAATVLSNQFKGQILSRSNSSFQHFCAEIRRELKSCG